ncbi:MAG: hypothetical protein FJZ67_00190 [Bacteroidetes bacterium]|nr:hypothetical protein [Bacteroidota bacterium]
MTSSFEHLLDQIDAFIRKFYKNEMIKGILLFTLFFLFSFLLTTTLEYVGRFSSGTRAFLFFGFIAVNVLLLVRYIFIPLSKLVSFGKRINRYQASEIIGSFFPEISDRLKNTLQLNDALDQNEGNLELIRASVLQKSAQLNVIPFTSAIDFRQNKKYLRYLLPIFTVFVLLAVFVPSLITQGTERVVNYNEEYAPFQFYLNENKLTVEEGQDAEISLILKGSSLPENVYMISENGKFLMDRVSKNFFKGIIRKPKESSFFYFTANDYTSDKYQLNVIGKSILGKLEAKLAYPSYLGKTPEVIQNAGDLTIPEGTQIEWSVLTKNTKKVEVNWNGNKQIQTELGFKLNKKVNNESKLKFKLYNAFKNKIDSVNYVISVIKDAPPTIDVEEFKDSVADGVRYFKGQIGDDYGLKSLYFVYKIISENGSSRDQKLMVRPVSGTQISYEFAVDFRREKLQLKDRIEYYFVVSDNDGVNGSKSSRSQSYTYKLPTLDELIEKRNEDQEKTKEGLTDLLEKTNEFQRRVEKLKKEALNSKSSDWNKMNQVNQLQDEQKNLIESLEQIKNDINQSTEEKNQLSEIDKELLEKQEMIEKLLDQLMDDELKKLLEDLEKLLEKNDKENIKDKLDQLDQSTEDMKKQLDRSLEMLKRLQVNEKIDDIEKQLKELAKEQEELKKEIENKKISEEKSVEKQEEINKKFDQLKDDLNKLNELNKDLDNPMNLGDTKEQEEKISNELNESKESLEKGKSKKAGESQKEASDQMEQLAQQLDQQQQKANQKQQEEDMDALRNILESLMTLSFDQEDLMNKMGRVSTSDPAYLKYGRRQRRIIDDTKIVKDSLLALAKRQPKIASFIDKELNAIETNHQASIEDIEDRRKKDLGKHQQLVMTSYNNLALLLNEALQSMQAQMQSQTPGNGSCNNPGKGRPKPGSSMSTGDMKEMLKKQLEQMQKGPNPGGQKAGDKPGDKPGSKPSNSGQNMLGLGNKEIAKMAAEQTAIRQKLEQLRNEMNKEGQGLGNKLNLLIKELEQQEKDLINRNINKEMINRQRDIMTRLLESEKALMERGFEEKRESKSGKDDNYGNKIRFDEYNKQKLKQIELLKSADPTYKKYYKDKANQYFNGN